MVKNKNKNRHKNKRRKHSNRNKIFSENKHSYDKKNMSPNDETHNFSEFPHRQTKQTSDKFCTIAPSNSPRQNIQNSPNSQPPDNFIRLYNIGNSCYLNSALQCLVNNKLFVENIKGILNHIKGRSHENLNRYNLLYYILDLIEVSKTRIASPVHLKQLLSRYNEMFRNNMQQDTHECLTAILDIIHEETKTLHGLADNLFLADLQEPKSEKANKANKQLESFKNVFGYSIINHIFSGQFISTTCCTECHQENHEFDTFTTINLDIPKNSGKKPDIRDCFYKYFVGEVIDDYVCNHCPLEFDGSKHRTFAKKRLSIWKFPRILILSLKRFPKEGVRDNSIVEINNIIQFQVENSGELLIYDLAQIVNHEGHSPYGGHYTTINIDQDDNWAVIDDHSVISLGTKRVKYSRSAYVLIYVVR